MIEKACLRAETGVFQINARKPANVTNKERPVRKKEGVMITWVK